MSNCTNCSHTIPEPAHYCNYCGQSTVCFERPFRPVFTDMLHETLDIDGRMIKTVKTLIAKPGMLSLEYCRGKRMMYTPPLRMYLVVSILFFLLWAAIDSASGQTSATTEHYPKLMFCLLPVFALILQMLFKKTYYLSNLIFAIHIHCIGYLVFLVEMFLNSVRVFSPDSGLEYIVALLRLPFDIYLLVYCALALKRNYGYNWRWTMIKYVMLLLLYFAVISVSVQVLLALVE
ncbi:MAG: DUF3667 domain-containing protein [Algicola sp.]|nr:DUF3667 domain-containing protein [Algicola sp.]